MNDDDYDKLKGLYGEQAARSLERVYDANSRIMEGQPRPLDAVSVFADGTWSMIFMAGHGAAVAAKAIGEAAEVAGHAIATGIEQVTKHDKPVDTPAPPAASAPDGRRK
jgi:hypothetical protein